MMRPMRGLLRGWRGVGIGRLPGGSGSDGGDDDTRIAVDHRSAGPDERVSLGRDRSESAGQGSQRLVVADEVAAEATGAACTGGQIPPTGSRR